MSPTFMTENLVDTGYGKQVGADKTHLKVTVTQGDLGPKIGGIGFGLGKPMILSAKRNRLRPLMPWMKMNGTGT